jgi:hypothetical protein
MKFVFGLTLGLLIVLGVFAAHGFIRPHKSKPQNRDDVDAVVARIPRPGSTPDSPAASKAEDQEELKYKVSDYSRLYDERQRAALVGFATNPNLEAARHADDWKRAGDWDQGFLRMQETFKASLDPAPAVPAFQVPPFQVPPFQVPPVQLPAVPACCVAP